MGLHDHRVPYVGPSDRTQQEDAQRPVRLCTLVVARRRPRNASGACQSAYCGVLALPLHDGILVGERSVEHAADAIRESALKVLGFEPLVKPK